MNGKVRQVDGRLPRPARLVFGRNELRRPCDRIEGAILLAVSAAFLTVLALAALLAGHIYNSQHTAAAGLRPTVAILSEPGPVGANGFNPAAQVQAQATWRLADGAKGSGLLTASTAPAIDDAWAGSTVPVWLNRSGDPQPPAACPGRNCRRCTGRWRHAPDGCGSTPGLLLLADPPGP
jgi:hypothetical protein